MNWEAVRPRHSQQLQITMMGGRLQYTNYEVRSRTMMKMQGDAMEMRIRIRSNAVPGRSSSTRRRRRGRDNGRHGETERRAS